METISFDLFRFSIYEEIMHGAQTLHTANRMTISIHEKFAGAFHFYRSRRAGSFLVINLSRASE